MKHYHLSIVSKTKKSLYDFLNLLDNQYINSNIVKKSFKSKKRKKKLTILKSPHVNKTAQEQFQSIYFSIKTTIYFNNNFQYLVFLKKMKNNLFPDIKINIKLPINQNLSNKTQVQIFNPNNFKLNIFKKCINQKKKLIKKNKHRSTKHFIMLFDLYGELTPKMFG